MEIIEFMKILFFYLKDYLFLFNIIFMIIIIFSERKTPLHSLFWISLLLFAPNLGFITFLFFGLSIKKTKFINKYHPKVKIKYMIDDFLGKNILSDHWKTLVEYLAISQSGALSSYDNSTFFSQGHDFFDSLKIDIENAKRSVYLEFFIFKDDSLGLQFFSLLCKKSMEGVKVKLLLDGTNILSFFRVRKLKKAGIDIEFFFPLYLRNIFSFKLNYRNHKKIAIIDGEIAYIGGFNIGKEYIGKSYLGNWRDSALRIQGEILYEFEKEFLSSWNFARNSKKKWTDNIDLPTHEKSWKRTHCAQLVSSGPHYQLRTARDNFLKLITGAQKSIYIETPYFIPDETLLSALKIAATSGVKVKIIIPNKSDHPFIYWINQAFLVELLEFGVQFYKYSDGFLHSKFMIVDDKIASLGSTNFDYRSFYDNFELNINLYSESEVVKLRHIFVEDLKKSTLFTAELFTNRTIFTKMKESIFRLFSPIL